jgi:hypothetical protein
MLNATRVMDIDTRRARWARTQQIEINWAEVYDTHTFKGLENCALSTGTPIDFYSMPLLSTAASFMNGATVLANPKTGWKEPSIIWSVISATPGKLAALVLR